MFLGLAAAQKANAHIQVEILLSRLNKAQRVWIDTVANWIAFVFVAVTSRQMLRFTISGYIYDARLGSARHAAVDS